MCFHLKVKAIYCCKKHVCFACFGNIKLLGPDKGQVAMGPSDNQAGLQRHRAGLLKQQNKSHKTGRHRSKGQIHKEAKGNLGQANTTR